MKQRTVTRAGLTLLLAASLFGCSRDTPKWQSPASAEKLTELETITLNRETPPKHRAELLFLWGQELAQQAKQSQDPQSASDLRAKAIAAFTRVVDMHNVLLKEARFNLEILWKEEAQQNNANQDNQDQKKDGQKDGQKQDGQQGQNGDQQDGKQSKADQQSGNGQSQAQKDAKAAQARDLSSLVREKAGESELDRAVKAEQTRQAQKQQVSAGKATAVAKDW